jgi:competence protein ComEC
VTAVIVGGAAAGILTSVRFGDALAAGIALASICALVGSSLIRRLLCVAGLGLISCASGARARDNALAPPVLAWFEGQAQASRSDVVAIEGRLVGDASVSDTGVRLLVDAARPARGRILVNVGGAFAAAASPAWTNGRPVRVFGTIRRPQILVNFGGPSPRWQMLRRPAALLASVKSAALIEVERGAWWDDAASAIRRRVRSRISRVIGTEHAHAAAITTAILIGDRAGLDDELERQLQAAGTYHVIAISGGNVALIVAAGVAFLRMALRSSKAVSAAALLFVVAFGWIVGAEPSVLRAVTAASVYLIATFFGIVPSPTAVIRTAACALALCNPLNVIDPGAWLSFGATLGIVLFATRWARAATGPLWPRISAFPRALITLAMATLAAETVIAPISATVFGRVSTAGVILNLVAIPAMAAIQASGLIILILEPVSGPAASLVARFARVATDALVGSSDLVNVWTWLSWRVPRVGGTWLVIYYVLSAVYAFSPDPRWRRWALVTAAASLAVILSGASIADLAPVRGHVRVTVLDVGQGDAILVQAPGGFAMLVDTGGSSGSFDVGGRVVTPAAWALGARHLTSLTLTHGDRDHSGGAIAVMHDLQPREIWEGVPVLRDADRARIRNLASALGIPWRTIQAGDRLELGEVVIEAAHPPAPEWERQKIRNDDSIVLRVRLGRVEMWLTGDAGAEFERHLPDDAGSAAIRVLKVGHHGSRTSTSAGLVAAIRPQIAIISVGGGNLFGHPAPDVTERLSAAGAEIFRTDRDGAVVVETDGVSAHVLTPTGRRWSVGVAGDPLVSPRSMPPRAR